MPKTFLEQINPLLFLCKLTGFQTFVLNENPQIWEKIGMALLQVPLFCFYTYCHLYTIYKDNEYDSAEYFKGGDFTAMVTGMHNVIVKRVYYIWYRNSLRDILKTVSNRALMSNT